MTGKFGITVLGSGSKGNAAVIHGPVTKEKVYDMQRHA